MTVNVKTNNNTKALVEPDNISNPNLLINPDFKINQRGEDTYSVSSGSMYSVDRWKIWSCSFNADTKILKGTSSTNVGTMVQTFEKELDDTYTFSIKVLNITGGGGTIWFENTSSSTPLIRKDFTSAGIYSLTYTGKFNRVTIKVDDSNTSMTIEWVKLEKGTNVTQFIEPDPATELIKCQRYYLIASHPVVAMCMNYTNPTMLFVECMGIKNMRTSPTTIVTGSNKTTYLRYDGIATEGLSIDTSKVSANYDTGMYKIQFTKGTIPNAQNKPIAIDINDVRFRFDAEIY